MGIPVLDAWASRLVKSMPLTSLRDSVVGIDASYYLESLLSPSKEPLLSALGGFPFALESTIVKEIGDWQSAGLEPHFVFNGLVSGTKDEPFGASIASAAKNAAAFERYEKDMASEAISVFKTSGAPTPAALTDFLKKVFHEHGIGFTVAPFSALAQLAYYEKDSNQLIDAIYGPSELFLYGVEKIITKFDLVHDIFETTEQGSTKRTSRFAAEDSSFRWLDRQTCLEELGHISVDLFTDACLLAGSSLLRTIPPLQNPNIYSKGYSIRDVVRLITSCGHSVTTVCRQYQDDSLVKSLDYLDRYRRAVIGIKHHVVITKDGNVETLDAEHAPSDVHDCVGQRLPEELNMYLSRGMLRTRVPTWLTSGIIHLDAPLDGGNSVEYQNLVKTQLEPWRRDALCLLSESIHRYYQRKEITTRLWYDQEYEAKFNIKDLLPSSKEMMRAWNVKADAIAGRAIELNVTAKNAGPGSLHYAIQSLTDQSFSTKTTSPGRKDDEEPLKSLAEVTANVAWRFLQLRGFIGKNHQLTAWGKVLQTVFSTLETSYNLQEAAFVAVELMRLGLLNADTMFPDCSGAPLRGTVTDRRNCMLVARVASLGKLRHQPRGYSGPLSRHLLAYHSITSAVHHSLRDLVEMSLATMFLEGDASRDRDDWMDLSLSLPFYSEDSCALGIVIKTYLDELCTREDSVSEQTRAEMKMKGQGWVDYADFNGSLEDAFVLWDAVYSGVKEAGDMVKDRKMWEEVDEWLAQRK